MKIDVIKQQRWYAEIQENPRLQWMLLIVACIIMLSLAKSYSDTISEREGEVQQQKGMVERLLTAAARPLSEDTVAGLGETVRELKASALGANSPSVAEAQALKRIDGLANRLMERPQASLINTETVRFGNQDFWQIRIEVRGRMNEKKLIELLAAFDSSQPYQRISAMQYRPKASDAITLVVDYLYMKDAA